MPTPIPEPTATPTLTAEGQAQERFSNARGEIDEWWSTVDKAYPEKPERNLTDAEQKWIVRTFDTIAWGNRIPIDGLILSTGQPAVDWCKQKNIVMVEENGRYFLDLTQKVTQAERFLRLDSGWYGAGGKQGGKRSILMATRAVENLRSDYGKDLNDDQVAVLLGTVFLKEGLEAEYRMKNGGDEEHTRLDVSVFVCELLAYDYDSKDSRLAQALRDKANLLRNWQEQSSN